MISCGAVVFAPQNKLKRYVDLRRDKLRLSGKLAF